MLEDAFVMQNAAIVLRDAYVRVGPFDEDMLRSLDYDMFVRLALAGTATYCDRVIFDQRKHDGVRGPVQARHAATSSGDVWRDFDQHIFRKVNKSLALSDYAAMFDSSDPKVLQRAARLQRACVNARHDLWEFAIVDLKDAADLDQPLTSGEIDICSRILNGKHGISGTISDPIRRQLDSLLHRSPAGREIVRRMLAGALWRVRASPEEGAAEMRRLIYNLLGPIGLAGLLMRRHHRPSRQREFVTERSNWPPVRPLSVSA